MARRSQFVDDEENDISSGSSDSTSDTDSEASDSSLGDVSETETVDSLLEELQAGPVDFSSSDDVDSDFEVLPQPSSSVLNDADSMEDSVSEDEDITSVSSHEGVDQDDIRSEDSSSDEDEDEEWIEEDDLNEFMDRFALHDYDTQCPPDATTFDSSQYLELPRHTVKGMELAPGNSVGLKERDLKGEKQYFYIVHILKHCEEETIHLRGWRLVYTSALDHVLSDQHETNECTLLKITYRRKSLSNPQDLDQISVKEIHHLTSVIFVAPIVQDGLPIPHQDPLKALYCRTVAFLHYNDQQHRKSGRHGLQGALRWIKPAESEIQAFGSAKIRKGISEGKYTMIDLCCGAGGATEAAKMVGLKVTHAFEISQQRADVYRDNNPRTHVHVHDLLKQFKFHASTPASCWFSTPCDPYSQNKTRDSEMDEPNKELLRKIPELIHKLQPRQVVIEQVPGLIMIKKHRKEFEALIGNIMSVGYNLAWKVIDLKELGCPSERKRLIIMASALGEALPPFPKALYGRNVPFRTVDDAFEGLPEENNVEEILSHQFLNCERDEPFPLTITTSRTLTRKMNGQRFVMGHPEENRRFSTRELARLMTFPDSFTWHVASTPMAAMIGGAVPPLPMSMILKQVVRTLKGTDGEGDISRSLYDEPLTFAQAESSNAEEEEEEEEHVTTRVRSIAMSSTPTAPMSRKRPSPIKQSLLSKRKKTKPYHYPGVL